MATANNTLDISKIKKVYSGGATCMCGCEGKWSLRSDGMERSVKIIAGKIQRSDEVHFDEGAGCYYVRKGDRILAAYLEE